MTERTFRISISTLLIFTALVAVAVVFAMEAGLRGVVGLLFAIGGLLIMWWATSIRSFAVFCIGFLFVILTITIIASY